MLRTPEQSGVFLFEFAKHDSNNSAGTGKNCMDTNLNVLFQKTAICLVKYLENILPAI